MLDACHSHTSSMISRISLRSSGLLARAAKFKMILTVLFRSETACTVAMLHRGDVLSFFERNPAAWPSLVKLLCQRLRHTNQVFAEVALLELPVRLAKTMLRVLTWAADSAAAEPAKIRFSQRELANMLGGSRESVNKCLRNWQRTGVVRISGGSIVISDRRALENIAGPA